MIRAVIRNGVAVLACAAVIVYAAPGIAANINLQADLKGSNEVPPSNSSGSGSVTATFDTASKQLSWKGSVSGLSGPATAAHFHAGEAGKNGAVVLPITGADTGSFAGTATLTDPQANDLLAGKWYVNIHTQSHKAGEIRGQLNR
ncbi:MAG TPA: CHRD domain-containing protein [Pseudolabrys sp.]|nr:CHRD domain-containing protein [Pseudolabrys sp.]